METWTSSEIVDVAADAMHAREARNNASTLDLPTFRLLLAGVEALAGIAQELTAIGATLDALLGEVHDMHEETLMKTRPYNPYG